MLNSHFYGLYKLDITKTQVPVFLPPSHFYTHLVILHLHRSLSTHHLNVLLFQILPSSWAERRRKGPGSTTLIHRPRATCVCPNEEKVGSYLTLFNSSSFPPFLAPYWKQLYLHLLTVLSFSYSPKFSAKQHCNDVTEHPFTSGMKRERRTWTRVLPIPVCHLGEFIWPFCASVYFSVLREQYHYLLQRSSEGWVHQCMCRAQNRAWNAENNPCLELFSSRNV